MAVRVAVHLSFDLFPKGWSGFALISVPGYGWTAPWFSGAWIAISIGEGAFWRPVVVLTVATAGALIPAIHHAKSSTR